MSNVHKLQHSLRFIPALLLVTTISLNIMWPLTQGHARSVVTICGVLTFFVESKIHSFINRGLKYTITFILIVLPLAFLVEVIGTHTGFPFGDYTYSHRLGIMLFSVPVLIPLAWFMMMYPSLLIAQSLTTVRWKQVGIAAWLMATWDLFLDPQMVNEGFWTWHDSMNNPTTVIPLTNFVGWFVVSAIIFTLLLATLPKAVADDDASPSRPRNTVPYLAVIWVWLGSFIANVFTYSPFLNQPRVAFTGLIGMGIVLAPWSVLEMRKLRARSAH
jgi:putative membrane protein